MVGDVEHQLSEDSTVDEEFGILGFDPNRRFDSLLLVALRRHSQVLPLFGKFHPMGRRMALRSAPNFPSGRRAVGRWSLANEFANRLKRTAVRIASGDSPLIEGGVQRGGETQREEDTKLAIDGWRGIVREIGR